MPPDISLSSSSSKTPSGCGKVVASLFLSVFLLIGLLFCFWIAREVVREAGTYLWRATDCIILASSIVETDDDGNPYQLTVSYRYVVGGRELQSSQVALQPVTDDDYAALQEKLFTYAPGSAATCYVNPRAPAQAVLLHRGLWFGAVVLLPLVFVLVGGGGIYFVWRGSAPTRPTALSSQPRVARAARFIPIVLGLIFTAVGTITFVFLGVVPAIHLLQAQRWREVECRVLSSTVRSHAGDDSTTYSVDILYEYTFAEHTWRNNRYDFVSWSSSGYEGKQAIVQRYPEGSRQVCYVNPARPSRAVLNRQARPAYLVGLIPLAFAIPGIAVLWWGLKLKSKDRRRQQGIVRQAGFAPSSSAPPVFAGPVELKPQHSPLAKLVGMVVFSLIWNGIIGVFLYHFVVDWRAGSHQWGLALFLVPFVLVGVGTLWGIVYFALALFNPVQCLTMSPGCPRLGASFQLSWELTGASQRLDSFTITLEGREEATYRRGTDTHTDKEVFAVIEIVRSDYHLEFVRGSRSVEVPGDVMHSFAAPHNKIVWSIKVAGDIPRWPDISTEFEVQLLPVKVG